MRNAAYLGVAEETRLRFLEDGGFPMTELYRRKLGPVVVEDVLAYRKELRLLEPFRVDMAIVAISAGTAHRRAPGGSGTAVARPCPGRRLRDAPG